MEVGESEEYFRLKRILEGRSGQVVEEEKSCCGKAYVAKEYIVRGERSS